MSSRELVAPDPDHGLLSENDLIAMYMREVGPIPRGIFAATQVSDTVADALECTESEELEKGLTLIEQMGQEGLGLEYAPLSRDRAYRTNPAFDKANISVESCDVASVDTCGQIRDLDYDSDFDETDSLMECGDAMPLKLDSPASGPGGSMAKFNLYKLLDAIQARHLSVSAGLQGAHTRLERLREQNRLDCVFLSKLHASSDVICEKIHEIKADVADLFSEIESMKTDNAEAEGSVPSSKTSSKQLPTYSSPYGSSECDTHLEPPQTVSERAINGLTFTEESLYLVEDASDEDHGSVDSPTHKRNSRSFYPHLGTVSESLTEGESTPTTSQQSETFVEKTSDKASEKTSEKTSETVARGIAYRAQVNMDVLSKLPGGLSVLFVVLLGFWLASGWNLNMTVG